MSKLMRLPSGLLVPGHSFLRRARPTLIWNAKTALYIAKGSGELTLSGNEITDVIRAAADEGDGRAADDSMGIWEATENKVEQSIPGALAATGLTEFGDAVLTKETDATAPFGSSVWKLDASEQTVNSGVNFAGPTGNTNPHTLSLWARLASGSPDAQLAYGNNGSPVAVTSEAWARVISAGGTPNHNAQVLRIRFVTANQGTVYFQAAQLEEQPVATPFVKTDGAAASRAAGCVRGLASLLDETQGWVAVRVRVGWDYDDEPHADPGFFSWGDDDDNSFRLYYDSSEEKFEIRRANGGAVDSKATAAVSFASGDFVTLIAAWDATEVHISVDGAAFVSAGDGDIPTLAASTFDIGDDNQHAGREADSDILWSVCGKGTLSDADAAYIHAVWAYAERPPSWPRLLLEP